MSRTALLTHADCALHEISPGHPEQPARMAAILDQLEADNLLQSLDRVEVQEADRDHLILAHPQAYVDAIINASPASGSVQLDADTAMNEHSLRAAMLAVGAGVKSVELVLGDQHDNTFCCVRPPGHHAEETTAMGFCFFGSVAIASIPVSSARMFRVAKSIYHSMQVLMVRHSNRRCRPIVCRR